MSGGNLDGTAIGQTEPAPGTFTTLDATSASLGAVTATSLDGAAIGTATPESAIFTDVTVSGGLSAGVISSLGAPLGLADGGTGATSAAGAMAMLGAQDALSGAVLATATPALDDKLLLQDSDDADALKTAAVQGVLNLVGAAAVMPTGATTARSLSDLLSPFNVLNFGAVGDGVTDDSAAFQAAITAAEAAGDEGGTVVIPNHGTIYRLDSGLTVNPMRVRISGDGATLDASAMTSGTVFTFTHAVDGLTAGHQAKGVSGLRVFGPGKTSLVDLFRFTSSTAPASSQVLLSQIHGQGFRYINVYGNRAYHVSHVGCSYGDCAAITYAAAGYSSSAVDITHWYCSLSNADLVAEVSEWLAQIKYFGCALTDNAGLFLLSGGRHELIGCRISMPAPASAVVTLSGSNTRLVMSGGELVMTSTGLHGFDAFFDIGENAEVVLDKTQLFNLRNTDETLAKGTGRLILSAPLGMPGVSVNPMVLKRDAASNLLSDGGFEESTIKDLVFFNADTAGISSRTVGGSGTLSVSTKEAHSGSQSLLATKTNGAGGTGVSFCIAAPIQPRSRGMGELYYKKPGATTGTIWLSKTYLAIAGCDASGVPVISRIGVIGSKEIVCTTSPIDWTRTAWFPDNGSIPAVAPAWATHMAWVVTLSSFNAGDFHIDDVIMQCA